MDEPHLDLHFAEGDLLGVRLFPCPDGGTMTIGMPRNTAGELGYYLTSLAQGATILDLIGRH